MLRRALPVRGFVFRPPAPFLRRRLPQLQRRTNATVAAPPLPTETVPKSVNVDPETIEEETIRGTPPP
jgi:hypothetical protein